MHQAPWSMGSAEWVELALFWLLMFTVLALVAVLLRPAMAGRPTPEPSTHRPNRYWQQFPEVRLLVLGLPLELLWEIAQFPLYDVWHQGDWGYILYGLAHCTLGDLLILVVIYELVAGLRGDRRWYRHTPMTSGAAYTLFGVGYTVFSELVNVRVKGTWGYTELMPIVPGLEIGATPFLQWLLIPPLLLWLMYLLPDRQPAD